MPLFGQVLRKKHAECAGRLGQPPADALSNPFRLIFVFKFRTLPKIPKLQLSVEITAALAKLGHHLSQQRNGFGPFAGLAAP
jgi:hypothetical protein